MLSILTLMLWFGIALLLTVNKFTNGVIENRTLWWITGIVVAWTVAERLLVPALNKKQWRAGRTVRLFLTWGGSALIAALHAATFRDTDVTFNLINSLLVFGLSIIVVQLALEER